MPRWWSARPTRSKLPQLQIILRELEDLGIPRFLFLNKIDRANKRIRETLATLQPASRIPLVLRQIPIWNGELIAGFVDLALERAFVYREHKASEVVALEGGDLDREKEARFSMLEKLADHDDALMEQLLEDIQPPRDAVFDDLARELREGLICPVLLGSARARERRAAPDEGAAPRSARRGRDRKAPRRRRRSKDALAYVFKTVHLQHGGKLSLTRLLAGHLDDGATLQSSSGESRPGVRHPRGERRARHQAPRRRGRRHGRARQARRHQDRRHAVERQDRAAGAGAASSRRRRCWRWRLRRPTARTTSSSARPCCG